MPRATNAPASRRRRKRVLKQAKGYFGNKSRLFRYANDAVKHGLQHAYKHRRLKKRTWRALWITRVNIACRAHGITYSRFMEGLIAAGIELNRKVLADIAARDEAAFTALVDKVRAALDAKANGSGPAPVEAPKPAPKAEPKPAPEAPAAAQEPDDLTRIEGIGPKIAELFVAENIRTYADLAAATPERLKEILVAGGGRFATADPGTWPEQAAHAAKGDWDAFRKLTDELEGGRRV